VDARLLRFDLDDLRHAYGVRVAPGADPRHDTAPFRAFRAALLEACAAAAAEPCLLEVAWEGTFNGYVLAVAVTPPGALPGLDAAALARAGLPPADDDRVAPPPRDRYPLAHVEPGRATVARNPDGTTSEAPFGAATGHFGAPGMRKIP
jgi:hypothetical protein